MRKCVPWLLLALSAVAMAYAVRPRTYYDPLGYIDDGHGHPGTSLHLTAVGCTILDDLWEWAPGKDGVCHFSDVLNGQRYMSPTEIADSPAPQEDLNAAYRWCQAMLAHDALYDLHTDAVQMNGRDFSCRPFHQN